MLVEPVQLGPSRLRGFPLSLGRAAGLIARSRFSPQSELRHAVNQLLAAQIQEPGRMGLVPIELLQRPKNRFLFYCLDIDARMPQFQREEIERRPLSSKRLLQIIKSMW